MGRSALNSGPGVFAGSVAIVFGALSWSVGIVYSRRSHLSGHPLLLSALSLLAGLLLLLLLRPAVGEYPRGSVVFVVLYSLRWHSYFSAIAHIVVSMSTT